MNRRIARCVILTLALLLPGGVAGASPRPEAARLLRDAVENLNVNPKEASSLADRAIKLCDTSGKDSICREATIVYGDAEQLLGNFDFGLKLLFSAQEMTDTADTRTLARIFALQGRVFSKLGDYPRSKELNDKATSMFRVLGDSANIANCYNERGVMLLNLEQYPLAEHFFRRSLDINRRLRNLRGIARNLNNICLYPGDSSEKLKMIEEAIAINKNLDYKWALGENYNNKGKQLCYAGRFGEAIEALDMAYGYIDVRGAKELLCDNHEYRAMAYAGLRDYAKAYDYMQRMTELVRGLQLRNSQRNTELELQQKRDADRKNAAERQEQDYRIKILHRNLWILVAVVVLGCVSAWFCYKWYRHSKNLQLLKTRHELDISEKEVSELKVRQQQLELENARNMLTASRQELTGFAAFLKSRNEMMERIRDMLKEGYKMDPTQLVAHMKKISAFISSYATHDKSSQALLLKAEERNKVFMDRLLNKHPGLTKGERNLALLIRGGMSTKEISMLLGLETKTVNMNRYRLRKSLDLPQDTDLSDYLQAL